VFTFFQKRHGCDFPTALQELARFAGLGQEEPRPGVEGHGLTLEQFAAAKRLPVDFLRECGVKDAQGKDGKPYVVFAYRERDVQVIPEATRMCFATPERPKARRGGKAIPYGLWRIPAMLAEDGELNIFEGRAITLTAWNFGLPAMGLHGKTMARLLDPNLLDGFKVIYVWQEPDAEDFPLNVAKSLPGFVYKRKYEERLPWYITADDLIQEAVMRLYEMSGHPRYQEKKFCFYLANNGMKGFIERQRRLRGAQRWVPR
jgi:hypothetical protein